MKILPNTQSIEQQLGSLAKLIKNIKRDTIKEISKLDQNPPLRQAEQMRISRLKILLNYLNEFETIPRLL
jgi:hypothetical protein